MIFPPLTTALLHKTIEVSERPKPQWSFNNKEYDGNISLNKIVEIVDKQGLYSQGISRNRYAYEIARFANKEGHSPDEVESFLINKLAESDFKKKEIRDTVKSAYKR